ncbi:HNH endonuclease signature motif containing protein [Sinorhizobium fredii]|uniref:HNH endonuclease signature motif containing protein n=1 Tax=Rhizobium fredii TaxID=380 RepID=UPI0005B3C47A|nr:HNH endonuclease signature motif containing protein [Sinorhizobium fredii]
MKRKTYPARDYLAALFEYCPDTGVLTWKQRPIEAFPEARSWRMWNTRFAGKTAGHVSDTGYLVIRLDGEIYKAHLIAWILHYGGLPEGYIDHISGTRSDNRVANMRDVTRSQNMRNTVLYSHNTSGFVGVYWHQPTKKWNASIRDEGGKTRSLGYFDSIRDAASARKAAEARYGYHPNHGRVLNHGVRA